MTVVAPNGLANICIWPLTTIILGAFKFDVFELDVADIVNNCTRPKKKRNHEGLYKLMVREEDTHRHLSKQ